MKPKIIILFLYSSGVLLLVTASAKLTSGLGSARILQTPDPLLLVQFRYLFLATGALELIIAVISFLPNRVGLRAGLIAWLVTNFVVYRIGLLWVGYHKPCSCLGNLTDALHISPNSADTAMKIILGYLLIGSYAALFWLWNQRRRPDQPSVMPGTNSVAA